MGLLLVIKVGSPFFANKVIIPFKKFCLIFFPKIPSCIATINKGPTFFQNSKKNSRDTPSFPQVLFLPSKYVAANDSLMDRGSFIRSLSPPLPIELVLYVLPTLLGNRVPQCFPLTLCANQSPPGYLQRHLHYLLQIRKCYPPELVYPFFSSYS